MTRSVQAALGGAAGILSGVVWLVLTPIMATVWICDPVCVDWSAAPLVVRTVGRQLAEYGAFTYAAPFDVYFDYGRFFPIFYLLATTTLLTFHLARGETAANGSRLLRWSFRVLLGGMILSGVGDFASYTLGRHSEWLWSVGFGVEVISWLIVCPALITYGAATLRAGAAPRSIAFGFMAAGAVMPLALLDRWLVQYMPNRQLLPVAVLCVSLGVLLLTRHRGARVASAAAV